MSKLNDLPPEDFPGVVRLASELLEEDRERRELQAVREELRAAATEVDIPPEYLERAANLLQARRAERAGKSRRWRGFLAAGVVAVLFAGLLLTAMWLRLRAG